MKDRQTDGQTEAISISPSLFKKSLGIITTHFWIKKKHLFSLAIKNAFLRHQLFYLDKIFALSML